MTYLVKVDHESRSAWVSVVEVAKYVRSLLKQSFPSVKFSVTSDKYAGGSSIRVSFAAPEGFNIKAVGEAIDHLHGHGFDGSIDMGYYREHYLLPDGTIVYAGTGGTTGSGGYVPPVTVEQPEGAIKVSLSNSFIFCTANGRTV